MNCLSEELSRIMLLLNFPEEAQTRLSFCLHQIIKCKSSCEDLQNLLHDISVSDLSDYSRQLTQMTAISETAGIHPYEGHMLLMLEMCPALESQYHNHGLSPDLFLHTMLDLRYKLEECHLVYGIWGTFVGWWYKGFFQMNRFCLGRLQFELVPLGISGMLDGLKLTPDTSVLNVHIPRTGTALDRKNVLSSYRNASVFYQDYFRNSPMIFACESWLLYPWNLTVLPENSNIRKFAQDYTLLASGNDSDYSEIWRLFDCLYTGNPNTLPGDSSLRRAYIRRIQNNLPVGWGHGASLADRLI